MYSFMFKMVIWFILECGLSACVDNIKMVYGDDFAELNNFKHVIREESNDARAHYFLLHKSIGH
jgi:hypothetical protein